MVGLLLNILDDPECPLVGDGVGNTDAGALVDQPVVNHQLDVTVESPALLEPALKPEDMEETAGLGADGLLVDPAVEQDAVLDQHLRVVVASPAVVLVRARWQVNHIGEHQGPQLLACPELNGAVNRRNRDLPVPVREEHQDVHHLGLVQEGVARGERRGATERVLDDAHDRPV